MLKPYCSCIVHTLPHVTARACRFHYARCHSVEARQWGMAPCAQRHTGGVMQDPEKMLEGEASSGMAAKGGTGAKQQLAGVLTSQLLPAACHAFHNAAYLPSRSCWQSRRRHNKTSGCCSLDGVDRLLAIVERVVDVLWGVRRRSALCRVVKGRLPASSRRSPRRTRSCWKRWRGTPRSSWGRWSGATTRRTTSHTPSASPPSGTPSSRCAAARELALTVTG